MRIDLPRNLKKINGSSFAGTKALKSINISPNNQTFKTQNGVLFDITGSLLIAYPSGLNMAYTIPSTVGVQNSNYVGLKIIIRFYVDGDLTSVGNDTKAVTTYNYVTVAEDAKYTAGTTYYVQNEGVWGLANVSGYVVDSDIPNDWATLVSTTENVNYKYVNSAEVPTTASTLEIEFKAATITP